MFHLKSMLPALPCLLILAISSCEKPKPYSPPLAPITDTKPVGDGLKTLGFAILGSAVVCVLGRMIR